MTKILEIRWKPAPENTRIMHFGDSSGSLQVLVDEYPKFVYCKIDRFFYAQKDGFVDIFEWKPGTTRGFAGRKITLPMVSGSDRVFKGSLWDPYSVPENVPKFGSVSVTNEMKVWERGVTFYGYKMVADLYLELLEKAKVKHENPTHADSV